MDVIALLREAQTAYEDVQARAAVRAEAAAAHEAAHQAYVTAADRLAALQTSLSAVFGKVMPEANPRVRIG